MLVDIVDRIGIAVIDRPEKRNAVDLPTLKDLLDAQGRTRSLGCRILVVRGSAPAFCSGADLDGAELGEFTDVLGRVLEGFGTWPGLTIAYVDGAALGAGLQIAAACDVRIATSRSIFGVPAAKLGLAVDSWTVERLARELGWSLARTMLLTGDPVPAGGLTPGFLAHVIEPAPDASPDRNGGETALDEAMSIIGEWSLRAPLTIAAHKMAIERAAGSPLSADDVEQARLAAWNSADALEGRAAFRERRPPDFRGE